MGADVRSAALAGTFDVAETKVAEALREASSPVQPFDRVRPMPDVSGRLVPGLEFVPPRTYDLKQRIRDELPETIPYAGNQGILLSDVLDGKQSMDAFLAQLSDDELCAIVRGEGMCSPKVTPGTAAAFGGVTEALRACGIPCGCCSDGPSGIRMDCGAYAFSLPNGACLACTFNEALNEELFGFLGAELRKNRIDTILGPGMNIHRNPLNGRNFEYFSEDPLVTGKMAEALAQVPVTIFANGKNMGTLSFNGESDEAKDITQDLGMFVGANNFVKLYFAQSGIRIEKMTVALREKLTKPFWE